MNHSEAGHSRRPCVTFARRGLALGLALVLLGGCALSDSSGDNAVRIPPVVQPDASPSADARIPDVGPGEDVDAPDGAPGHDGGSDASADAEVDDGGLGEDAGDAAQDASDASDASDATDPPALAPVLATVSGPEARWVAGQAQTLLVGLVHDDGASLAMAGFRVLALVRSSLGDAPEILSLESDANGTVVLSLYLTGAARYDVTFTLDPAVVPAEAQARGLTAQALAQATPLELSFEVVAAPPDPAQSRIEGQSGVAADAQSEAEISIWLRDAWGNAVSGAVPEFDARHAGNASAGDTGVVLGPCTPSDARGFSACTLAVGLPGAYELGLSAPISRPGPTVVFAPAPVDYWVPNGKVFAVARDDDHIYLGGEFTRLAPYTGHLVSVSGVEGHRRAVLPQVHGTVHALVPDGYGGWYVGGAFEQVGHARRKNLARILADGTLDPYWKPEANGAVLSLLVREGHVYVGGEFTYLATSRRPYLAQLDADTGRATAWNPEANGAVRAMAWWGEGLWVGGDFTQLGGQVRAYLAQLDAFGDARTEAPMPNGAVRALLVHAPSDALYLAGDFGLVGTESRPYLAAFQGLEPELTPWNPQADGPVYALAMGTSCLLAGGAFGKVDGVERSRIACLRPDPLGTENYADDFSVAIDGVVHSLAVEPDIVHDIVFVGGSFSNVEGEERSNAASLAWFMDGMLAAALGQLRTNVRAWNPRPHGAVHVLVADEDEVVMAGDFATMGGVERRHLAALRARDGSPSDWRPEPNGRVRALAADGQVVVAGGDFSEIGWPDQALGLGRGRLAQLDRVEGRASAWNPNIDGPVRSVEVRGRDVWVAGNFTAVGLDTQTGGRQRLRAAHLSLDTDAATDFQANANARIVSMAHTAQGVVLVGDFTTINGAARSYAALVDPVTGALRDFDPKASNAVYGVWSDGADLFLSGGFDAIGRHEQPDGRARAGLASFGLTSDLADGWSPQASWGPVTLTGDRFSLVAGGSESVASAVQGRLRAFDQFTGEALSWDPEPDGLVRVVLADGANLWVAGDFARIAGERRQGLVRLAMPSGQRVASGEFFQGSPLEEVGRDSTETSFAVRLGRDFAMGRTSVTRAQWRELMGVAPGVGPDCQDCPVEQVNWWESLLYLNARSKADNLSACYVLEDCAGRVGESFTCQSVQFAGLACEGYRLPTEAEWEWAARALTDGPQYGPLEAIAWYQANAEGAARPVGNLKPNNFQLYDMLGNVRHWVWNGWSTAVHQSDLQLDPLGPQGFGERTVRGCAWLDQAADCRAARRRPLAPSQRAEGVGLRWVRTLAASQP